MEVLLPFKAEYAKSGRAGCKGCKQNIGQDSLRIAAMVQSAFHDGRQPNWFHETCFFNKQRPSSEGDIENFESLRFEDQERIKKKIAECSSIVVEKKGKKRTKGENGALKDFGIEYAKSARAACRGCEQKILKDVVRVKKTVFDSEIGMKYGGQALWHHLECFAQIRHELGWLASGESLPGFNALKPEHKAEVKQALPPLKAEDVPDGKKAKLEPKTEKENEADEALKKLVEKQNKRLFAMRDQIKEEMSKDAMKSILHYNKQEPYTDKLVDQLADMLTFGPILPCPECGGQLIFNKSGYTCTGNLTEWVKCTQTIKEPQRQAVRIPKEQLEKFPFLKKAKKQQPEVRAVLYIPPSAATIAKSVTVKKDEVDG